MNLRVAILSVRNRNRSISIGALVIKDELERNGIAVGICDYQTAFAYSHVLVSMTATATPSPQPVRLPAAPSRRCGWRP